MHTGLASSGGQRIKKKKSHAAQLTADHAADDELPVSCPLRTAGLGLESGGEKMRIGRIAKKNAHRPDRKALRNKTEALPRPAAVFFLGVLV
jgi:hypothetical protein